MADKKFYITTTLPYVNADPHIGFAMELVRADIIARYKKLIGFDVFFNTGTDEHGQKIFQQAEIENRDVQSCVDSYAEKFKNLIPMLGIGEDINFIRTTDDYHIQAAQEFWTICNDNGFIYQKDYQIKYCVGCELEKTDSELEDGRCSIHSTKEIELRDEKNYFFKFSDFQEKLKEFYKNNETFVVPEFRFNEIKNFIEGGLQDFSISRLKSKMPWGIPVPGDDTQVMYVWFDALVNYISTIGWPTNLAKFKEWSEETGGMVQYAGKDNLRQQAAIWQAMLMAAGLPNSKKVIINGFINGPDGTKMSKSLGNVVNPKGLVEEFGVEAVRYYIARHFNNFEDSDFSLDKFKEAYNANLANGLGNLVSRIMKMATTYGVTIKSEDKEMVYFTAGVVIPELEIFDINTFMDNIWSGIHLLDNRFISMKIMDEYIQHNEPFKKIKTDPEEAKKAVQFLLFHLFGVALALEPIMPKTSAEIRRLILNNEMPVEPLFKRQD